MSDTIKCRMVIHGNVIELETSTPEALTKFIESVGKQKNKEVQNIVEKKVVKRYRTRKDGTRAPYTKWTEHDVVLIAKKAKQWGEDTIGFSQAIYELIKESGDNKTRNKANVEVFALRMHHYLYKGDASQVNMNIRKMLTENGFFPPQMKQYLPDIGAQIVAPRQA